MFSWFYFFPWPVEWDWCGFYLKKHRNPGCGVLAWYLAHIIGLRTLCCLPVYSQESAWTVQWRLYKVCSDRLLLSLFKFLCDFFFLCVLSALSVFKWFVLWFAVSNILCYEIRILLLLANIWVKANVLLCLARLWTCVVGFSYSLSGPNIQPQSGVITPCEQKSVTRVPVRCLRLRRLPEWLVRVQRLQSFRCDKLSKL